MKMSLRLQSSSLGTHKIILKNILFKICATVCQRSKQYHQCIIWKTKDEKYYFILSLSNVALYISYGDNRKIFNPKLSKLLIFNFNSAKTLSYC